MPSVRIRAVSKDFGGQRAVDQVDLEVAEGEFLVLLGPSGCGKTTLLRMIAGLETPTTGDIVIGDRVVTRLAPRDRFVATFIGTPPMNLVERGGEVYGFRPETFLPRSVFGAGEALVEIPFRVQRVEYLGGDRLVYGLLEAPFPEAKVISKIPSTLHVSVREGERYDFALRRADERRFPAQT